MNGKPWTAAELRRLRKLYPDRPTPGICKVLRRSVASVYGMAAKLGINKSADFHADARRSGRFDKLSRAGAAFRFPKGHVPANKGLRRPGWAPGRMGETQFRKGHFPANRDPDFYVIGALRVNADGYIDMRVSFAPGACGWRMLHLILWEDVHGPIPKGCCLRFKDGDRLNVELGNLVLISRADNMRQNSIARYPQPLRSAIVALGQFKRRVREKQDRRLAQSPV